MLKDIPEEKRHLEEKYKEDLARETTLIKERHVLETENLRS